MTDVVLARSRWESTNLFLPLAGGDPKPIGITLASPEASCTGSSVGVYRCHLSSLKWLAEQTGSDNFRSEGLSLGNLK